MTAAILEFPAPIGVQSNHYKEKKLDASNLKVLVSEDEDLARIALIDLLGDYLLLDRTNFLEAVSLQSALIVFERQQTNIRAVLTDIDMPDPYAGIRLYHELRRYFGFTGPIALMSGRSQNDPQITKVVEDDDETRFFPKPIIDIEAIGDWLRRGWS